MRKTFRSNKAVSPVIATVLMILVVVVGMGLVFAFVSVYTATYQNGVGSSVLESLTIEDVWLHGTAGGYNDQATISIYNSGDISAQINDIYINGIAATNGTTYYPIQIGQHISITVTADEASLEGSAIWQSGASYDFKVTTVRGSSFEESISAS